jgi:hypothetical protein
MKRIAILMLGLSLVSILCWAAQPNADQASAAAAEPQVVPPLPSQVSPPREPLPPPPTKQQAIMVPAAAAEPQAKSSGNDAAQLKAAQEERINLLTQVVEILTAQYQAGTVDLAQVSSAENELCNALLDSTDEPEKRVALLTKQLDKANKLVQITEGQRKVGIVGEADLFRAKSQCLGVKIKLLRERNLKRPPTKTAPTEKAEATEPLPMSQVTDYMATVGDNTTIKNKQIAKRLIGRVYNGVVEVFDVDGDGNSLIVTSRFSREGDMQGNWIRFEITKPEVIKKVAELPRGAKVSITAKLSRSAQKRHPSGA